MSFSELVDGINSFLTLSVPVFRVCWTITILVGATLLSLAFVLKKNPERKKSPWVVGGSGVLMLISSGTQLLFSFLL